MNQEHQKNMTKSSQLTRESEMLFARSKAVAPGGVHSPVRSFRGVGGTPRFIKSAHASRLMDMDGNSYADYCMSWGPLVFGHNDPEIKDAVIEALHRGWTYGAAEPYSLELAELMIAKIPGLQKVRFVSSGTEAVMSALRVARAATGRDKILKFDGCYHGHTDSLLVRAGSGLADMASPDSAGVSRAVAAETLVCPLNDEGALREIFEIHCAQAKSESEKIAAVILEPVPANNGLLIQRTEWTQEVMRLARRYGVLVIFDEVITGFRVGFGGFTEEFYALNGSDPAFLPDLMTYGKVMGGGFPIGAYGGRRELMDLVAPVGPVYQAGTLSANPVAVAAGLTTLKKLLRENPYAQLEAKVSGLANRLNEKLSSFDVHIQNKASLFWMVFGATAQKNKVIRSISQIPAQQKESYAKVFHALLESEIYLAPSGYEVSFLSTAHLPHDLEALEHNIIKSVEAM